MTQQTDVSLIELDSDTVFVNASDRIREIDKLLPVLKENLNKAREKFLLASEERKKIQKKADEWDKEHFFGKNPYRPKFPYIDWSGDEVALYGYSQSALWGAQAKKEKLQLLVKLANLTQAPLRLSLEQAKLLLKNDQDPTETNH